MEVKILDCTLRDGGYVNNWTFGEGNIDCVVENLVASGIDFVELGFLKPSEASASDTTLFDGINSGENSILRFLKKFPEQKFTLMLNIGEIEDYEFIKKQVSDNLFIRLAFRKNLLQQALSVMQDLVESGVQVFLNPMFTNSYTEQELQELLRVVNQNKPFALSVTDTAGAFTKKDLLRLVKFIDKNLDNSVKLAFHSHNNLNLSLDNAKALISLKLERDLILDSCVGGMGRGAGNLDTLAITKILLGYKLPPLQTIVKQVTKPIYAKTPWGVSNALYYCAKFGCHPDYGMCLEDRSVNSFEIKRVLACIPEDYKYKFNSSFIKEKILCK